MKVAAGIFRQASANSALSGNPLYSKTDSSRAWIEWRGVSACGHQRSLPCEKRRKQR